MRPSSREFTRWFCSAPCHLFLALVLSLTIAQASPVAHPSSSPPPHSIQVGSRQQVAAAPNLSDVHPVEAAPGIPVLDPNKTPYPRTSLHDFSDLLDAPAGKYGFLTVRGEHFYWPNGKRARFWGINVANTTIQQPNYRDIDAMIETFRTAGFNLLRLHHFDDDKQGGIIDAAGELVPAHLDALDYWIAKAKQSGLYVFLDLLDYRRFDGQGVPDYNAIGRGARPYSVFDPKLIELQKDYARKLLHHVNPYTHLAYADDPAIVMVELYDESGLLMRRNVWREMPGQYATEFKAMWNDWLKKRYGTTTALAAAWTDGDGKSALDPAERLEDGTVELPAMTWTRDQLPVAERHWADLARCSDGARFAYDVHKKYFREMRGYLRDLGVKVPISATGRYDDMADLKSMSEELDYIGCNFYYDHPYWASNQPQWQPPSFYHGQTPMHCFDDRSMGAAISLARVHGKPLVVREWNYCWPNENRASGMVEAAAYADFYDVDAMVLFGYETKATAPPPAAPGTTPANVAPLNVSNTAPCISYFNVRSDPSRWGLCGIGAEVFLRGLIQPSKFKIVVPYGPVDTFVYHIYHQPLYALGWATRVENDFYDGDTYRAPDDGGQYLIVSPGRSGLGRFEGAPALVYSYDMRGDLGGKPVDSLDYLKEYHLVREKVGKVSLKYDGLLYDRGTTIDRVLDYALPLNGIVADGLQPIGTDEAHNIASGFLDRVRRRLVLGLLQQNEVMRIDSNDTDVARATLEALRLFYDNPAQNASTDVTGIAAPYFNDHNAASTNVFITDTAEMMRDAPDERLVISAPQFQALCGNLSDVGRVMKAGLRVRNMSHGTLVALSLDGKPLVESRHFMIKMVTDARNVDEKSEPGPGLRTEKTQQCRLDVLGNGPVTTSGQSAAVPIQIGIEHRPLVDVYLNGGSFELVVDGDDWKFYCDTPEARFKLYCPGAAAAPKASNPVPPLQQVRIDGAVKPLAADGSGDGTTYPEGTALVRSMG